MTCRLTEPSFINSAIAAAAMWLASTSKKRRKFARLLGLPIGRDRVLVGGGGAERQVGAGLAGHPHCVVQQEMRPV